MNLSRHFLTAFFLVCPLASTDLKAQQTVDVGGIAFPTTVNVGGSPLILNGSGVRYRAFFKTGALGLYLTGKADTPEAALALPGPKRIRLVILRNFKSQEMGKMMAAGVEANASRAEFAAALPAIIKFGEVAAQVRDGVAGDEIVFDWNPSIGTTIRFSDKANVGPYKDVAVFNAFAKIWLGKSPADPSLKDALLGRQNNTTNTP